MLQWTEKQLKVLEALRREKGPIRPHELALKMGYTESGPIIPCLTKLVKYGLVVKTGSHKQTKYEISNDRITLPTSIFE